jgi:hypothetical protein
MKINKRKIELYSAFRDGERNELKKYIAKSINDTSILIGGFGKTPLRKVFEKYEKEIEELENKYKLNVEEMKVYIKRCIAERCIDEKTKKK